jgi:capsular polysaccharide biosynthesis protein
MSTTYTPGPSSVSLARYATIVRRQWRIVAVAAILGSLAAFGYLYVVGQSYTAQTDVNINVISTDPFNAQRSASGLLDATTEAQLAMSFAVAGIAAKDLDVSAVDLRKATEASVVPDATVIRIRYSGGSEDSAVEGANAIAEAYLAYRSTQAEERLSGIVESVNTRIDGLRGSLAEANGRIAGEPVDSTEYAEAVSDRDLLTLELNNLLALKATTESIDTSGGSILSSAAENEIVVSPGRTLTLATGLLAGLALGLVAAFVWNAIRGRVSGRDEVTAAVGGPVLASLVRTKASIPATDADRDEIRTVRERILTEIDPRGRIVLVVDDTGGPISSDVPLNLGIAFADIGYPVRVVLPGLASEFTGHLRNTVRFSVSRAKSAIPTTLLSKNFPGLRVIVPPADRSGQLMSVSLRRVLAARDEEETTILVLPPVREEASLLAAAREAAAVIFLVETGVTRRQRAEASGDIADLPRLVRLGSVIVPRGRRLGVPLPESRRKPRVPAGEESRDSADEGSRRAEDEEPPAAEPPATSEDDRTTVGDESSGIEHEDSPRAADEQPDEEPAGDEDVERQEVLVPDQADDSRSDVDDDDR